MSRLAVALATIVAIPSVAAADKLEVGFVNLTAGTRGQAAIASLRAELRSRSDLAPSDPQPALERPRGDRGDQPPDLDLHPAREAYRQFQTDKALSLLDKLDDQRRTLTPTRALFAQFASIALLRGQVLAGAERTDEAYESFARAYALSRKKALDPARYPPAVRKAYTRAVERANRSKTRLAIEAPAGATIWVDGRKVGDTPLKPLTVAAGKHLVTGVLAGHLVDTRWVETGEVSLALEPLPAVERVDELRETLSPRALDAGILEQIAEAAQVDALVVIATRDGALAAALFIDGKLGAWGPPGPELFGDRPPDAAIAGGERSESRPWYTTWWGVGLIGSGAAITTLIVVGLLSGEDRTEVGGINWL